MYIWCLRKSKREGEWGGGGHSADMRVQMDFI